MGIWEKVQDWCTNRAIKRYGVSNGKIFFRCIRCTKICTMKTDVLLGCCHGCGGNKFSPTNLTLLEEIRYVFF